jgi:hypothetical protein
VQPAEVDGGQDVCFVRSDDIELGEQFDLAAATLASTYQRSCIS